MFSRVEVAETNLKPVRSVHDSLYAVQESAEPPLWTYYHKPIIVMVIGALVLGTGLVLALLSANEVPDVPHALGPVCLSIGMMFTVLALVWLPIIKDKLRRKGLKTHERSDME